MRKLLLSLTTLVIMSGCTSLNVRPVSNIDIDEICVVKNNGVNPDFLGAYINQIQLNGYKAKAVEEKDNNGCAITSTYAATYGNHWGVYLATATLKIYDGDSLVGEAKYKAPYASPEKHGRVEGKINKMVDQLLPAR